MHGYIYLQKCTHGNKSTRIRKCTTNSYFINKKSTHTHKRKCIHAMCKWIFWARKCNTCPHVRRSHAHVSRPKCIHLSIRAHAWHPCKYISASASLISGIFSLIHISLYMTHTTRRHIKACKKTNGNMKHVRWHATKTVRTEECTKLIRVSVPMCHNIFMLEVL